MLPDKKLKNRFLLAAFASQLPALLWFINLEFVHNSFALDIVDIIFTAIGFFTGIYALIILIRNWKIWSPVSRKITFLIILILGLLINVYALFCVYAINAWMR